VLRQESQLCQKRDREWDGKSLPYICPVEGCIGCWAYSHDYNPDPVLPATACRSFTFEPICNIGQRLWATGVAFLTDSLLEQPRSAFSPSLAGALQSEGPIHVHVLVINERGVGQRAKSDTQPGAR
jgi:hypothetical protein